jgi:hypothetical protein
MPANAGIQNILKILDPDVRRDDGKNEFRIFHGAVKIERVPIGLHINVYFNE